MIRMMKHNYNNFSKPEYFTPEYFSEITVPPTAPPTTEPIVQTSCDKAVILAEQVRERNFYGEKIWNENLLTTELMYNLANEVLELNQKSGINKKFSLRLVPSNGVYTEAVLDNVDKLHKSWIAAKEQFKPENPMDVECCQDIVFENIEANKITYNNIGSTCTINDGTVTETPTTPPPTPTTPAPTPTPTSSTAPTGTGSTVINTQETTHNNTPPPQVIGGNDGTGSGMQLTNIGERLNNHDPKTIAFLVLAGVSLISLIVCSIRIKTIGKNKGFIGKFVRRGLAIGISGALCIIFLLLFLGVIPT